MRKMLGVLVVMLGIVTNVFGGSYDDTYRKAVQEVDRELLGEYNVLIAEIELLKEQEKAVNSVKNPYNQLSIANKLLEEDLSLDELTDMAIRSKRIEEDYKVFESQRELVKRSVAVARSKLNVKVMKYNAKRDRMIKKRESELSSKKHQESLKLFKEVK